MEPDEIEKIEEDLKRKQQEKEKTPLKTHGRKVFELQKIIKEKAKKYREEKNRQDRENLL